VPTFDDQQHEIRVDGRHKPTEMGEMLRFPSAAVRTDVWRRWGIDHPDVETRSRNIRRFQASEEIRRYKVYKNRLF